MCQDFKFFLYISTGFKMYTPYSSSFKVWIVNAKNQVAKRRPCALSRLCSVLYVINQFNFYDSFECARGLSGTIAEAFNLELTLVVSHAS